MSVWKLETVMAVVEDNPEEWTESYKKWKLTEKRGR